jgi:ketosteroid isomerase-like protein
VTANNPIDSRLALVYELLRELAAPSPDVPPAARDRGRPFTPAPALGGRMSATDILSWWFRPASSAADPWDDYFSVSPPPATTRVKRAEGRARVPAAPPADADAPAAREPATEPHPWANLPAFVAEPETELADELGDAVVECLYGFVHAVGRGDVEGAMALVADDFHVLEDDREIDRLALRHQLESLLDSLRGWTFEISLAEIPEPLFHPCGVLVYAEIQIDAARPDDDLRRCQVEHRVVVFDHDDTGGWKISALSPVSPHEQERRLH